MIKNASLDAVSYSPIHLKQIQMSKRNKCFCSKTVILVISLGCTASKFYEEKLPFPQILHHHHFHSNHHHNRHHPVSKLDLNIFYSFEEKVVAPGPLHSSSYQEETEVLEFLSPDVTFDKIFLELR